MHDYCHSWINSLHTVYLNAKHAWSSIINLNLLNVSCLLQNPAHVLTERTCTHAKITDSSSSIFPTIATAIVARRTSIMSVHACAAIQIVCSRPQNNSRYSSNNYSVYYYRLGYNNQWHFSSVVLYNNYYYDYYCHYEKTVTTEKWYIVNASETTH